jgi:hypothetical protein
MSLKRLNKYSLEVCVLKSISKGVGFRKINFYQKYFLANIGEGKSRATNQ